MANMRAYRLPCSMLIAIHLLNREQRSNQRGVRRTPGARIAGSSPEDLWSLLPHPLYCPQRGMLDLRDARGSIEEGGSSLRGGNRWEFLTVWRSKGTLEASKAPQGYKTGSLFDVDTWGFGDVNI